MSKIPSFDLGEVRQIGWQSWDPLDLKDMLSSEHVEPPIDEYDNYLILAFAKLAKDYSVEKVADYLWYIATDYMCVDETDELKKACEQTAEALNQYHQRVS